MVQKTYIATDGSAWKGVGGSGIATDLGDFHYNVPNFLLTYSNKKIICGGKKDATNNRGELYAVIMAIIWAEENHINPRLVIISDSEYVIGYLKGRNKLLSDNDLLELKNGDLLLILRQLARGKKYKVKWTKAHIRNPTTYSELLHCRADKIASYKKN